MGLVTQSEGILEQYKMRLPSRPSVIDEQHRTELQALETAFDRFEAASERVWREPWLDERALMKVASDIQVARADLMRFGISERDMKRLGIIETERAKAIDSLVTALALNDLRTFMTAEANRNLEPEARMFTRSIREGFGLEQMTQRYLLLVQYRIRKMGFEIGGGQRCGALFTSTAR